MYRLLFIYWTFIILCTTSCVRKSPLKQYMEDVNSQCPILLDNNGKMISVECNDSVVEILYEMDDNTIDVDSLVRAQRENLRYASLGLNAEEYIGFFQMVADDNCSVCFRYRAINSKKDTCISISREEINNILSAFERNSPEEQLDMLISMMNASCPITISNGSALVKVEKHKGQLVFLVELDGCNSSLREIREKEQEVKEAMLSQVSSHADSELNTLISLCLQTDRDFVYYHTQKNSDTDYSIIIEKDELKEALKNLKQL